MRWLSFLQQALSATAAAAAGGAATVVTANPVLGAAAGAAAKTSTEELLAEFLPAQQQALDTLLDRTRSIELLLGEIHSNIEVLLEGPWRTALLHIEDATTHPEKAADTLELARQFLYQAYGLAPSSARRAIIAQELSAVYALLGEHADSLHWLFRAYPDAEAGVGEALADVIASFSGLSPVRAHVKTEAGFPVKAPPGVLVVLRPADDKPMLCVQHEPLATALAALALSCRELAELRLYCATVGMPQHWKDPPWRVEGGEEEEGFQVMELQLPGGPPYTVFGPPYTVLSSKWRPFRASTTLQAFAIWSFRVTGVPVPSSDPPGDAGCGVFLSGPRPELGAWREELAIPLAPAESFWRADRQVLDFVTGGSREYKYFYVAEPGGPAVWELGPNRTVPRIFTRKRRMGTAIAVADDSWGQVVERRG
jgi:hypothetical protein